MNGFHNRSLRVNLTEQTWAAEHLSDEVLSRYLGGKGLGAHLLLENATPGVDPLAPQSPLVVTTGPATGTDLAPASRYALFAKSPLTGIFGESYSGGHVAPKISSTAYDAIVIEGAADRPVYLEISDQGVKFGDAAPVWGMGLYEAQKALEARIGVRGAKAIVIGPAGERCVPFAVVGNDEGHVAGRTGMGAMLGSKKVKGIVFHGNASRPLYDEQAIKAYDRDLRRRGKDDAGVLAYRAMGTPMMVAVLNTAGGFPSTYWSAGTVPHWEEISAEAMAERFEMRSRTCHRCLIACRRVATVRQGRHEGLALEGPEYETIFAFGGLCAVDDPAEILYLNDICDRLGMDTMTAGNVAAFAIEASRRGALDLGLDYGDVDGIADLLRQIAKREGPGDLLAQGVRAASEALHLEDLAVHVKGLEPAGYDPRVFKGMGLAYAVSDRGACHLRATVYKAELSGVADRNSVEGKAELLLDFEDRHTIFDTLIFCRFYRDLIGWDDLSHIVHGLTGLKLDKGGLQALSARIADRIRQYNLREGMEPAEDTLPRRFLDAPLEPSGETLSEAELQQMVQEYYALRGW
ncbi:MAG: aldehyde ferredoxin oxidoreductase family protein [Anaerolineae bacterium]